MKAFYYLFILIIAFTSCKKDDDTITNPTVLGFQGELEWEKTFGGTNDETAQAIIETSDGGFVISGTTRSINGDITDKTQEENDFWVFKIDSNNNLLWSKTFGGTSDDQGQKIVETSDGGLAFIGYSLSSDNDVTNNEGLQDKWLIKLDSSGNLLWEKSFGFIGSDQAYSVISTQDNGLLIAGFLDVTASGGLGNKSQNSVLHGVGDFWVHKLDVSGTVEWRNYYGGTNNDRAYDVVETNDNSYIVVGSTESDDVDIQNPVGSYDFWAIKINASGNLIWEKSFGGTDIDIPYTISKTLDGNFVIAGQSQSTDVNVTNPLGSFDYFVMKISPVGTIIWNNNFGGTGFDTAQGSFITSEGDILITGSSKSSDINLTENQGSNDFWILKLDTDGNQLWQRSFGGTDLDFAYDIIETSDQKLITVGKTISNDGLVTGNHGGQDVWILKIK